MRAILVNDCDCAYIRTRIPETSVTNYESKLRNMPKGGEGLRVTQERALLYSSVSQPVGCVASDGLDGRLCRT